MSSMVLKIAALAAAAMATTSATAATTVPYTFKTVGSSPVNGAYGNTATFDTTTPSTLQLSVTAWQSNLVTNTISSAYLGTYAGGIGVTGAGDAKGAYNLHQLDNVGWYTDFVLLEFNRPVTLTSIVTNSYGIGGMFDNDAVWYNASAIATPAWNSTAGFASASLAYSGWHDVATGLSGATRTTGATGASTKWLVAPEFLPLSARDDGFKIASITVSEATAAVPEPATWAMAILGFGAAGVAMRRRRGACRSSAAHA